MHKEKAQAAVAPPDGVVTNTTSEHVPEVAVSPFTMPSPASFSSPSVPSVMTSPSAPSLLHSISFANENSQLPLPESKSTERSRCRLVIRELSTFKSRAIRQRIRDNIKDNLEKLLKKPDDLGGLTSQLSQIVGGVIHTCNATCPSKAMTINNQFLKFLNEVGDGSTIRAQLQRYYEDTQTFSALPEDTVHNALLRSGSRSSSSPLSAPVNYSLDEPDVPETLQQNIQPFTPSSALHQHHFAQATALGFLTNMPAVPLDSLPTERASIPSAVPWSPVMFWGPPMTQALPSEMPFYPPPTQPFSLPLTPSEGSAVTQTAPGSISQYQLYVLPPDISHPQPPKPPFL